ncbi:MAG: low specificity L-threonine aldolase [Nitratireductor sp.]|nr:low specificity L-threonine aldolase [Nitratireductor sp.]
MHFSSDNWAGAADPIATALAEKAGGFMSAYGTGELDRAVEDKFAETFEHDVAVLPVATGTAANSLALALAMKPGGIALAHAEAHVVEDECGAPELMMGAGRIEPVEGALAKIDAGALARHLRRYDPPFLHHGRAVALTLTQATEVGTVYSTGEIAALAGQAKQLGMKVHMDGARFANALVHLDCTPAEMTWKAGVDMVSFGGTKNGCWCAEALVLFDPSLREEAEYLRKRAGQLFSKQRFVSLQFDAYLEGGLWLDLARHANAMADRLRSGIASCGRARLAWPSQANEVFAIMSKQDAERAQGEGARFYEWPAPHWLDDKPGEDEAVYRLVTSFASEADEIDRFAALLGT